MLKEIYRKPISQHPGLATSLNNYVSFNTIEKSESMFKPFWTQMPSAATPLQGGGGPWIVGGGGVLFTNHTKTNFQPAQDRLLKDLLVKWHKYL